MKKCYVGRSSIHGKGVLLSRDVKKDETIFLFLGTHMTKTSRDWFHFPNALQVGYAEWIVPKEGSVGEALNHSCQPSAGVKGKNRIVAMRSMKKGEEVTIDYALTETYPLWHMRCACGSKNCRKVVKPYQDMPATRMKKYVPYTSQYILDMKMHLNWQEYLATKTRRA